MIHKIHKKATELIELMDERIAQLNNQGLDDSQLWLSWLKGQGMMSNLNKHLDYERKTVSVDEVSEEGKTENIS